MKRPKQTKPEAALQKVQDSEKDSVTNLCKRTGTATKTGAMLVLNQMACANGALRNSSDRERAVAAFDLITELAPANATEALLAVQMVGVHDAATCFLKRATLEGQTFEGSDANVLRATRLMRLFNEQVELMAKLKGKTSQQKVTVEHVHVHDGGQAIVGAVSTGKTGRGEGEN